jgi:hypothetical protein
MIRLKLFFLFSALVIQSTFGADSCNYVQSSSNCLQELSLGQGIRASMNTEIRVISNTGCHLIKTPTSTPGNKDMFIPFVTNVPSILASKKYDGWTSAINFGPTIFASGYPKSCTCTGSSPVSWAVGSASCNALLATQLSEGGSSAVTDATAPTTGTATFRCVNGSLSLLPGSTCVGSCAATLLSWTVGANTCQASSTTASNGASSTLTDSTGPATGSANFTCNNGTWSGASSASCSSLSCSYAGTSSTGLGEAAVPSGCKCNNSGETWCPALLACENTSASCGATTKAWGTNCSASLASANNGVSSTISNTASNYSGSATFTCSNGTWSGPTSSSCTETGGCAATTLSWNVNCSSPVLARSNGASISVTNTASDYTGSATFTCSNGNWSSPSGNSCTASGGGSCSWPSLNTMIEYRSGCTLTGNTCSSPGGSCTCGATCTRSWNCANVTFPTDTWTCGASTGSACVSLYWWSSGATTNGNIGQGSTGYRCSVGKSSLAHGQTMTDAFGDSPFYGGSPCGAYTTNPCPGGTNHNEGTATLSCNNGVLTVTNKSCTKLAD